MFVLYATSSANTAAQKSNRKTITGGDVISAMSDMEFEKVTIHNIHILTRSIPLRSIHILRYTNHDISYMRIRSKRFYIFSL